MGGLIQPMAYTSIGNIVPGIPYKDAPPAIEWLCRVFGFSKHLVVPDGNGGIAHTQLALVNGMIMLVSYREGGEYDFLVRPSGEVEANSQTAYIVVGEINEHYRRTVAAVAEIVYEIADQDYGGRLYSARNPEGHLWNLSSYDPWAESDV